MDERFRGTLQRHFKLLMTHLALTDDLIHMMAREKILPETMIKDIQAAETKEKRNECLLNSLRLRGNNSFKKFRELMYRTGNFFIADLLWEEDDQNNSVEQEDLLKFPGLLESMNEDNKRKFVQYLESKVREKALLLAWREAPKERKQALFVKATNFNQEKVFRDTIMDQEQKLKHLEYQVSVRDERIRDMQVEVKGAQEQIVQMQRDHRQSMDTQTKFHDANTNTISRLRVRMTTLKDRLQRLDRSICTLLDLNDCIITRDDSEDSDIINLEKHVKKLMDHDKNLEEQVEKASKQRNEVLTLLNRKGSKDPLLTIIKDVLRHEQRHRSIIMRDIMKLTEVLKQLPHTPSSKAEPLDPTTLETKYFKSQLAMLKAEAEHIHKRLTWKDSEIASLRAEISHLKQPMGTELSTTSPSSSTSTTATASSVSLQNADSLRVPPASKSSGMAPVASSLIMNTGSRNSNSPNRAVRHEAAPAGHSHSASEAGLTSPLKKRGGVSPCGTPRNSPSPVSRRTTVKSVTFSQDAAGWESRRPSLGDLDKTHVDVDRYLMTVRADPGRRGEGDIGVPVKPK